MRRRRWPARRTPPPRADAPPTSRYERSALEVRDAVLERLQALAIAALAVEILHRLDRRIGRRGPDRQGGVEVAHRTGIVLHVRAQDAAQVEELRLMRLRRVRRHELARAVEEPCDGADGIAAFIGHQAFREAESSVIVLLEELDMAQLS